MPRRGTDPLVKIAQSAKYKRRSFRGESARLRWPQRRTPIVDGSHRVAVMTVMCASAGSDRRRKATLRNGGRRGPSEGVGKCREHGTP